MLIWPLVLGFGAHICHYGDDGFTEPLSPHLALVEEKTGENQNEG